MHADGVYVAPSFLIVYRDARPRFRTIMTKSPDECTAEKIHHFSNPDVTYNEQVTGDAGSNCAQKIKETMVKCPASILRVS